MSQSRIASYFNRKSISCNNSTLTTTPPPGPHKRPAESPALPNYIKKRQRSQQLSGHVGKHSAFESPSSVEAERLDIPSIDSKRRKALHKIGDCETKADAKHKSVKEKFMWLHKNVRDAAGRSKGDPLYDGRTIQIGPSIWMELSASQKAYWQIKQKFMDVILFFKIGTFYELYEEDAAIAESLLGWKLTISGVGGCRQVGTPERAVDDAIYRLRAHGYKVGRIEQMETAVQAKAKRGPKATIIRELTTISSPATVAGGTGSRSANHLMALCEEVDQPAVGGDRVRIGFAFLDAGADHFYVGQLEDGFARTSLTALLTQVAPAEVLFERGALSKVTAKLLARPPMPTVLTGLTHRTEFPSPEDSPNLLTKLELFAEGVPECIRRRSPSVAAAMMAIVRHLQRLQAVDQLASSAALVSPYEVFSGALRLDGPTLVNLELLEGSLGGVEGSVLGRLDSCVTLGGRRLLRRWLCCPLTDTAAICQRQQAVSTLLSNVDLTRALRQGLQVLPDLERLLGAARGSLLPPSLALPPLLLESAQRKRLGAVGKAAKAIQASAALLAELSCQLTGYDSDRQADSQADRRWASSPPELLRDYAAMGAHLSDGARDVIELIDDSLTWPQEESSGRRGRSKAKSARAEENPTLNPELLADTPAATFEATTAEDAADAVFKAEIELTNVLLQQFHQHSREWEGMSEALAALDVLSAFAAFAAAVEGPCCQPTFVAHGSGANGGAVLETRDLWHPCAVPSSACSSVVANDVVLGSRTGVPQRSLLLTGPNMGGKSTLLRATCVAVVMAQMGCHVAAQECTLSPADRIFTRLGASDNIMAGESTFLVECLETSDILRNATSASVVVLDELGRGTSSCDGYSIAWAVLRHLSLAVDPRLLFATHFSMLSDDFRGCPRLRMAHMAALVGSGEEAVPCADSSTVNCSDEAGSGSAGGGITFLYKLTDGVCPSSYGLQVAGLAGIPSRILHRATSALRAAAHEGDTSLSNICLSNTGLSKKTPKTGLTSHPPLQLGSGQLAVLRQLKHTLEQCRSTGACSPRLGQLWRETRGLIAGR